MMGDRAKAAGFDHVDDYVKAVMSSGKKELQAGLSFLRSANLVVPLRAKDWKTLALRYNGPNYALNRYDRRLATAYAEAVQAQ